MARECRNRREIVIQWIGVFIALLGLAYNGVKDYQKGEIKFPKIQEKKVLTKVVYPVQYCLMAYDPNVDKVFYLHENGIWYDYAPQQRRYPSQAEPQQQNQTQGQEALGGSYRSSGTSGYSYGQSAQATPHTTRY